MRSLEEYIKEQEKEFWRTYPSLYLHCEPPYWDLERRNELLKTSLTNSIINNNYEHYRESISKAN